MKCIALYRQKNASNFFQPNSQFFYKNTVLIAEQLVLAISNDIRE